MINKIPVPMPGFVMCKTEGCETEILRQYIKDNKKRFDAGYCSHCRRKMARARRKAEQK